MRDFQKILKLDGLEFIKDLLTFEEKRFDNNFPAVYEEVKKDFGISSPSDKTYPVYFAGDITKPTNKYIFIGINPGYIKELNDAEQEFLEEKGSFFGYCHIFEHWGKRNLKLGSIPYYNYLSLFLKKLYSKKTDNWLWFQKHFINLDFIPYHSPNANKLRINNSKRYRERYFSVILKILDYLNPRIVFINGRIENRFKNNEFQDIISIEKKHERVKFGKLGSKFRFIGLPFLNRWQIKDYDSLIHTIRQNQYE